jgi:hypothetical protein
MPAEQGLMTTAAGTASLKVLMAVGRPAAAPLGPLAEWETQVLTTTPV